MPRWESTPTEDLVSFRLSQFTHSVILKSLQVTLQTNRDRRLRVWLLKQIDLYNKTIARMIY